MDQVVNRKIKTLENKFNTPANKENNIPLLVEFVDAFEKYSGLKPKDYKIEPYNYSVCFHTKTNSYEMDTYEGLTTLLKSFINEGSFSEIYTATCEWIWGAIYRDPGIDKEDFLPVLYRVWQNYWDEEIKNVKTGLEYKTHFLERKEESWKDLQVFMAAYGDDAVELAFEIDDMLLYPMVVTTMVNLYDPDVCYSEYCELEFGNSSDDFEWIMIDDDDDDDDDDEKPVFFIKKIHDILSPYK